MAISNAQSNSSRTQRLRSQALWMLLVAAIGLCATVVGFAQYVLSGEVSIRPGEDPLTCPAALESLFALFLVSAVFGVFGVIVRWRIKRRGAA